MNGSIKVKYSDFLSFSEKFVASLDAYGKWLEDYFSLLEKTETIAFASGDVHKSLVIFRGELMRIKDMPGEIAAGVQKSIQTYLDDLDAAQTINGVRILYGKKYPGIRDYSPDHFYKLRNMAEATDYNTGFLNTVADALEDLYYGFLKFFGRYNNSKKADIKKTQAAILQYNDVTKRQLQNIERGIGLAEENCRARLVRLEEIADALTDYISVFEGVMEKYDYDPMHFDVLPVNFADKYSAVESLMNSFKRMDVVTDSDVEEFIKQEQSEDFMNGHVRVVREYIADLSKISISDGAFWEIVAFQMFNIAEGQISTLGGYTELVAKKEVLEMMNELADNYTYDGSSEQELLEEAKGFLKYYKKYGKETYEYLNEHRLDNGKLILDGRTKEAIRFRGFLKSLDNAGKILEYGDQAINLLSTLFVDYNRNLEFLESFERNVQLNGDLKAAFEAVKKTYMHDLDQLLDDTLQVIAQDGVKALYSISVGKTVGLVKQTIGIIGSATGENAKTEARFELLSFGLDMVRTTETAFRESVRKLKEADPADEAYPGLIADVKNCFAIYKSSLCRMFEKMAAAAQGEQRDYFYYCGSHVSALTLKDFNSNPLMTYEEYLNVGYAHGPHPGA